MKLVTFLISLCCCLYSIDGINSSQFKTFFEDSDFHSLLALARISDVMAKYAVDSYKWKYASKPILISGPLSEEEKSAIHELETHISIKNYNLVKLTLQVFGNHIKTLVIDYKEIDLNQRKEIHRFIDGHCTDSLTAMTLMGMDENVLKNFRSPLKMVENVTIDGELKSKSHSILHLSSIFSYKNLKLNEIYPGLRRLTLNRMNVPDASIFDVEFSQLERVKITLLPAPYNEPFINDFYKTKPAMIKLFEKNPQIQTLILQNCNSLDYLRIASSLSNLNLLQVNFLPFEEKYIGSKIRFSNVKKIGFNMKYNIDLSETVIFDKVNEFVLVCSGKKECKGFPIKGNFNKLYIVRYSFSNEEFLELDKKAPNLKDVFIASDEDINRFHVLNFIQGNRKLKNLRITSQNEELFKILTQNFKYGWRLAQGGGIFTLERIK